MANFPRPPPGTASTSRPSRPKRTSPRKNIPAGNCKLMVSTTPFKLRIAISISAVGSVAGLSHRSDVIESTSYNACRLARPRWPNRRSVVPPDPVKRIIASSTSIKSSDIDSAVNCPRTSSTLMAIEVGTLGKSNDTNDSADRSMRCSIGHTTRYRPATRSRPTNR